MFGNVVSNAEIVAMTKSNILTIQPFNPQRLKLAHYRLQPGRLLMPERKEPGADTKFSTVHDFANDRYYVFQPNEYLVVEAKEFILLPPGIVGNFLPASSLIEMGFGLTAGKLDPGYGALDGDKQHILFGLKNQLDKRNTFDSTDGVAHIFFVDLRGLRTIHTEFSEQERRNFRDRDPRRWARAIDDGVYYPDTD